MPRFPRPLLFLGLFSLNLNFGFAFFDSSRFHIRASAFGRRSLVSPIVPGLAGLMAPILAVGPLSLRTYTMSILCEGLVMHRGA